MEVIAKSLLLFLIISAGPIEAQSPTEVLFIGTIHFQQFHNPEKKSTDFLSKQRQEEFQEVVDALAAFNPDAVCVEREPSYQRILDSLYQIKNLDYATLDDGLSEVFQIGFELAKRQKHSSIHGIDYYERVTQDLFASGENLHIFADSLKAFQQKGRSITSEFLQGKMTIKEFLHELNRRENIAMSHRLFYNTPAYIRNGTFRNQAAFSSIDSAYIGAEYISIFYERNLKIYTNLLQVLQQTQAKKIVVILGQVHVGVLKDIARNNPNFKIIAADSI